MDKGPGKLFKIVSQCYLLHESHYAFRSDPENNQIIYSQDFMEKSLNGEYDFEMKILQSTIRSRGVWNMTLYDYA